MLISHAGPLSFSGVEDITGMAGLQGRAGLGVRVTVLRRASVWPTELASSGCENAATDDRVAGDRGLWHPCERPVEAPGTAVVRASVPQLVWMAGPLAEGLAGAPRGPRPCVAAWPIGAAVGLARPVAVPAGQSAARLRPTGRCRPWRAAPPSDSHGPAPSASRLLSAALPPPACWHSPPPRCQWDSPAPDTRPS
jgi:hypothetical protein